MKGNKLYQLKFLSPIMCIESLEYGRSKNTKVLYIKTHIIGSPSCIEG